MEKKKSDGKIIEFLLNLGVRVHWPFAEDPTKADIEKMYEKLMTQVQELIEKNVKRSDLVPLPKQKTTDGKPIH